MLISVKDKKVTLIKETPFYIGYNSACDITIKNKALNDVHLCIEFLKNKFVIAGSTALNYSSVDDEFIIGYENVEIHNYSVIRAANELFVFVEGEEDFEPCIKSAVKRDVLRRARLKWRRVDSLPDSVKLVTANDYFSSYMNDECVDDVVFFAYERISEDFYKNKIVICISTESQKGTIKRLREISGTTGKISNAKITSLKMADDCEIEVRDDEDNIIARETFCWNGKVFFKGVEMPTSKRAVVINLKRCGKLVDSISINL